MTTFTPPDESLMARVAEGSRDDMEKLVRRYATPLLTFIRRMVGDHHLSEDLFQDVFFALWTKRHLYHLGRPFKPWLYAIAINTCHAAFRRRALPIVDNPAGLQLAVDPSDDSPAEAAAASDTTQVVERVLADLPTKQRLVVVLRIWDGLAYHEIAQALGVRQSTVRSHMHHALAALREQLTPSFENTTRKESLR